MMDTGKFKGGIWYWLGHLLWRSMFDNRKFKELLINALLSFIALVGVFALNLVSTRINHHSDFVAILLFLILMVIINWESLIGLLENYKDFDLVSNDEEKEIEDEFSTFNFKEATTRAFIMSLIMLTIVYYISMIFPDFITSIIIDGNKLKERILHNYSEREVYKTIIGFAIEIVFAALIVSTNYQNYKYR